MDFNFFQPGFLQQQFPVYNQPSDQKDIALIGNVPVEVTVEFGRASKTISEILEIAPGYTIDLDRELDEPVNIYIGRKFIARGEIVTVNDEFGVRVTEIMQPDLTKEVSSKKKKK